MKEETHMSWQRDVLCFFLSHTYVTLPISLLVSSFSIHQQIKQVDVSGFFEPSSSISIFSLSAMRLWRFIPQLRFLLLLLPIWLTRCSTQPIKVGMTANLNIDRCVVVSGVLSVVPMRGCNDVIFLEIRNTEFELEKYLLLKFYSGEMCRFKRSINVHCLLFASKITYPVLLHLPCLQGNIFTTLSN